MMAKPLVPRSADAGSAADLREHASCCRTRDHVAPAVVVHDGEQGPFSRAPDGDIATAAYTQAVALYDSCIRHAMANRIYSAASRGNIGTSL